MKNHETQELNILTFCSGKNALNVGLALSSTIFMCGFPALIILPFYIYLFGAGMIWLVLGAFLSMLLIWYYASYRLMRYSRKAEGLYTIPGYLRFRFSGGKGYPGLVAALEITMLTLICLSLILNEAGLIVERIFRIPTALSNALILVIILIPLAKRGFAYITNSAIVKAFILLLCLLICTLHIYTSMNIKEIVENTMRSGIKGSVSVYINILFLDNKVMGPTDYLSNISLGFLIIGCPSVLMGFLFGKDGQKLNAGKRLSLLFFVIFTGVAAFFGGSLRGYMYPIGVTKSLSEFIMNLFQAFIKNGSWGIVAGISFAIAVVVACMILVETCIYLLITTVAKDILQDGRLVRLPKEHDAKALYITEVCVAILAFFLTFMVRELRMEGVLIILAILSCSMGPVVMISLLWKRMNSVGCLVGLMSGFFSVPFYKFVPLIEVAGEKVSICTAMDVNAILLSMATGSVLILLTSLISPKPNEKQIQDFMDVKNRLV